MAEVRIQEGEPLENALRRFKRKVQQEDIIKEVKRHSFYLKRCRRGGGPTLTSAQFALVSCQAGFVPFSVARSPNGLVLVLFFAACSMRLGSLERCPSRNVAPARAAVLELPQGPLSN